MKLLSISIRNKKAPQQVQNIKRTLQGITTKGYLLITGKNRVQTVKGQPRIFKTVTGRKLANLAIQSKQLLHKGKSKLFNMAFVRSGILESAISRAKRALLDAKKMMLTTQEYFVLHVNMAKAVLHLRNFKYSLPKTISNLLF